MELLRFLISFLAKENKLPDLEPLLKNLQNNSFDLKKTLANMDFNALAPLMEALLSFGNNKNSPFVSNGDEVGLTPISDIGDKDIVYALNKYFAGQS